MTGWKNKNEVLSELPTEILNNVEIVDDKILEEAVKSYPDIQILIDQKTKINISWFRR